MSPSRTNTSSSTVGRCSLTKDQEKKDTRRLWCRPWLQLRLVDHATLENAL